ncbi:MAG: glycosyl hydrolase 108 family protein, partial [Luteibacter sp.]
MANFDTYIETLLEHEGGYVDDPWEPRGPSNKGITLGTLDECAHFLLGVAPSLANLRALNDAQASAIYRVLYWNRICGDDITYQPLANILFDFQVEAGSIASCL